MSGIDSDLQKFNDWIKEYNLYSVKILTKICNKYQNISCFINDEQRLQCSVSDFVLPDS